MDNIGKAFSELYHICDVVFRVCSPLLRQKRIDLQV